MIFFHLYFGVRLAIVNLQVDIALHEWRAISGRDHGAGETDGIAYSFVQPALSRAAHPAAHEFQLCKRSLFLQEVPVEYNYDPPETIGKRCPVQGRKGMCWIYEKARWSRRIQRKGVFYMSSIGFAASRWDFAQVSDKCTELTTILDTCSRLLSIVIGWLLSIFEIATLSIKHFAVVLLLREVEANPRRRIYAILGQPECIVGHPGFSRGVPARIRWTTNGRTVWTQGNNTKMP